MSGSACLFRFATGKAGIFSAVAALLSREAADFRGIPAGTASSAAFCSESRSGE